MSDLRRAAPGPGGALAALCVAACLALAGCAGPAAPVGEASARVPATAPATATETADEEAAGTPTAAQAAHAARQSGRGWRPGQALPPGEGVWRVASGAPASPVTAGALLDALAAADVVLLGEWHDQPLHAERRAALIQALSRRVGRPVPVVLEHASVGGRVAPGSSGPALETALAEAGFDARAWGWPLQRPMFEALSVSGHALVGGNLPRRQVRDIARRGPSAWSPRLATALAQAPLAGQAAQRLDAALMASHCGHMTPERLPGMRAAQRARDAAMAIELVEQLKLHGAPVVLLAGNGHVRRDHGVPQVLSALVPRRTVVAVGFAETDGPAASSRSGAAAVGGQPASAWPAAVEGLAPFADYVWAVPPRERDDPCAAMRGLRQPTSRPPAPAAR